MNIWSILFVLSAIIFFGSALVTILEYLRQQGNATRQRRAGFLSLLALFIGLVAGFARNYFEVQVSRRAMERFDRVVATFEVSVRGNAPGIAAYRDRLRSEDEHCLQRADAPDGTIQIEDPICQPQSPEEAVASAILSANVLNLDFFKNPTGDCGEPPNAPADLMIELPVSIRDHTLQLVYDRQEDMFLLKGRLESQKWNSPTGAIVAPTDLPGSQMVASLHGLGFQADAKGVYRSMELRYLSIVFSGTRSYERRLGPELQRLRREGGYPTYSYCFGPGDGL
jgi:hypothetical protein